MSTREPDYYVEITGVDDRASTGRLSGIRRPWIGILFDCCEVYQRVYRSPDGRFYRGRCPRCLRQVRLRVGPGGTDARFFTAS